MHRISKVWSLSCALVLLLGLTCAVAPAAPQRVLLRPEPVFVGDTAYVVACDLLEILGLKMEWVPTQPSYLGEMPGYYRLPCKDGELRTWTTYSRGYELGPAYSLTYYAADGSSRHLKEVVRFSGVQTAFTSLDEICALLSATCERKMREDGWEILINRAGQQFTTGGWKRRYRDPNVGGAADACRNAAFPVRDYCLALWSPSKGLAWAASEAARLAGGSPVEASLKHQRAWKYLMKFLGHKQASVRRDAAVALGVLVEEMEWPTEWKQVEALGLMKTLRRVAQDDKDAQTRSEAARTLNQCEQVAWWFRTHGGDMMPDRQSESVGR